MTALWVCLFAIYSLGLLALGYVVGRLAPRNTHGGKQ